MLRIALIDDHPVFRSGLRDLVARTADLQLAAEVDNARRASQTAAEQDVALFVVDVKLPDRDGIDLVEELHHQGKRCLVLSMYDDSDHVARALAAGARGYGIKRDAPHLILEAIRTVGSGGTWLSPLLSQYTKGRRVGHAGMASLSPREREIFDLLVRGWSGPEIARNLGISVKTVESHRYKIHRKLGVRSVAQLIRFAALSGVNLS
jgi:two-component system uhpT operon response regulator UhpA